MCLVCCETETECIVRLRLIACLIVLEISEVQKTRRNHDVISKQRKNVNKMQVKFSVVNCNRFTKNVKHRVLWRTWKINSKNNVLFFMPFFTNFHVFTWCFLLWTYNTFKWKSICSDYSKCTGEMHLIAPPLKIDKVLSPP